MMMDNNITTKLIGVLLFSNLRFKTFDADLFTTPPTHIEITIHAAWLGLSALKNAPKMDRSDK